MNFKQTKLNDVYLITPSIFSDNRGSFHEVFNVSDMEKFLDIKLNFVQQNQSTSKKMFLEACIINLILSHKIS